MSRAGNNKTSVMDQLEVIETKLGKKKAWNLNSSFELI